MASETKHTPTPWRAAQTRASEVIWADSIIAILWDGSGTIGCAAATETDRANAALIVRAVNAHDALVRALRETKAWIETLRTVNRDRSLPGMEALERRTDAALRLAEGE